MNNENPVGETIKKCTHQPTGKKVERFIQEGESSVTPVVRGRLITHCTKCPACLVKVVTAFEVQAQAQCSDPAKGEKLQRYLNGEDFDLEEVIDLMMHGTVCKFCVARNGLRIVTEQIRQALKQLAEGAGE